MKPKKTINNYKMNSIEMYTGESCTTTMSRKLSFDQEAGLSVIEMQVIQTCLSIIICVLVLSQYRIDHKTVPCTTIL